MKRAMGGEQEAITAPSITVVQRCTTEFLSLVVSEARARVAKERRTSVTYSDISTALNTLGFKQFQEPLKAHMALHYGGLASKRPTKRPRVEDDPAAHSADRTPGCAAGAFSTVGCVKCDATGQASSVPPTEAADQEGGAASTYPRSVSAPVLAGSGSAVHHQIDKHGPAKVATATPATDSEPRASDAADADAATVPDAASEHDGA